MALKKGDNPNHPRKGSSIKVDPIRNLSAIAQIKRDLANQENWRDYCLFTLGINTGWRANELLSIKVGQVRYLRANEPINLKQSKTGRYRVTPVNRIALKAIQYWLAAYGDNISDQAPLFPSKRSGTILVPTLCNMVKKWCARVCVKGQYGSHTLRKTWGFHQRVTYNSPLPLIMSAYGHSSERQTLEYLGIQAKEVEELYRNEI